MQILRRTAGFTLVEMMVVLGIIGVLTALLVANFSDARTDAKNKAFLAELKEVQLALELYKSQNGLYPPAKNLNVVGCTTNNPALKFDLSYTQFSGSPGGCPPSQPIIDGLTPDFIAELPKPKDAANDACQLEYKVASSSRDWYKLTAINCYEGVVPASTGLQRCPSSCANTGLCETGTGDFDESPAIYSAGKPCY